MRFIISCLALVGCAGGEAERIGEVAQRFVTDQQSDQVPASPTGEAAMEPTAAVIPDGFTPLGYGLVGFTLQTPTGPVTAWNYEQLWAEGPPTTPDWSLGGRADMGLPPWPVPANLGVDYSIASFHGYTGMAAVLWTGLTDVAAGVSYTAVDDPFVGQYTDVAMSGFISDDQGGKRWSNVTNLLSASFLNEHNQLLRPGGGVVRGSVSASLRYTSARTSATAGDEAIPIVVLWENGGLQEVTLTPGWWMTEVVFGPDGNFVQTRRPVRVPVIPSGPVGRARASIISWTRSLTLSRRRWPSRRARTWSIREMGNLNSVPELFQRSSTGRWPRMGSRPSGLPGRN